jgi:hypothetical protein
VLRLPLAAALIVSSVVLMVAYLWSWAAFGERVHHALLARPSLGDARAVLWFAAFFGYALLVAVVAGTFLAVAAM